jgi:hypothetical protein
MLFVHLYEMYDNNVLTNHLDSICLEGTDRLTNFLDAIIWQSLKNTRQIDQISGKKYMDLFMKKAIDIRQKLNVYYFVIRYNAMFSVSVHFT